MINHNEKMELGGSLLTEIDKNDDGVIGNQCIIEYEKYNHKLATIMLIITSILIMIIVGVSLKYSLNQIVILIFSDTIIAICISLKIWSYKRVSILKGITL